MVASNLKHRVESYPLISFFLLTFLISWLGWGAQLAYSYGLIPFDSIGFTLLGGLGPTIAAIIVTAMLSGRIGLKYLFGRLFIKGTRWYWFVIALLIQPLITAISLGIESLIPGTDPNWLLFPGIFPFLSLLFGMLISNVWEEIGWRGFALPRMQTRWSPLVSSLVLGLIWSLWHLPLMLNPMSVMASLPKWAQLPYFLGLSVLYTFLFNRTKGNLFVVTLFHATTNIAAFLLLSENINFTRHYLINVAVTILLALCTAYFWMGKEPLVKNPVEIISS